jgi:ATP-binding cassette subfamily C (CFTR/MRP) protein 1
LTILTPLPNSIDTETDIKIQSLINKEFRNHTVISVAHKLQTIAGFDFVGVMDDGKLVEYGNPKVLLQTEGSRFGELWGER